MTHSAPCDRRAALALLLAGALVRPDTGRAQSPGAGGTLAVDMIPYPADIGRDGPDVSYTAPSFPDLRHTITHDGKARLYYLHAPGGAGTAPRPAIVLLHGAQRSGRSMIDMWRATADRHDAVLVAPNSLGESWSPVDDDPSFLISALRDAHAQTPIDPSRVYLFGHSAGGILATLYANRVGGPWRAVATHAGILDASHVAAARSAPPMRHYLGTNDHLFSGRAAQATARALSEAGHDVELKMILGHTHWYYILGPHLSEAVWRYWQGLE